MMDTTPSWRDTRAGMATGRTIYLHIGTEKTGTTTLQAMFSTNRRVLAQSGILYPTTPGKANLAGLAIYALPQANRADLYSILDLSTPAEAGAYRERFVGDFSAEIERSECRDIVMSSEHLSSRVRQPGALQRLFDMLGQFADTIKVIVYLRPQHELAPSSYSTSVKSGNAKPFRAPQSDDDYFYNYDLLTRNWETYAGRENTIVRVFSRSVFKNNSLIADIFDAMSLPQPSELVVPADRNKALGMHSLEFMRIANTMVPRRLGGRFNPDHIALVRLLNGMETTPKFEIDYETARTIENVFSASNRSVAERYFPASNGQLFPPARATERPSEPPTSEDLVRLAVDIWRCTRAGQKPRRPALRRKALPET